MDSSEKQQKNFIRYEYKEIVTVGSRASFLLDGYESFGWEIDGRVQERKNGPGTAAALLFMYSACHTRIFGLDIALFSLQKKSGETGGEAYAANRSKI